MKPLLSFLNHLTIRKQKFRSMQLSKLPCPVFFKSFSLASGHLVIWLKQNEVKAVVLTTCSSSKTLSVRNKLSKKIQRWLGIQRVKRQTPQHIFFCPSTLLSFMFIIKCPRLTSAYHLFEPTMTDFLQFILFHFPTTFGFSIICSSIQWNWSSYIILQTSLTKLNSGLILNDLLFAVSEIVQAVCKQIFMIEYIANFEEEEIDSWKFLTNTFCTKNTFKSAIVIWTPKKTEILAWWLRWSEILSSRNFLKHYNCVIFLAFSGGGLNILPLTGIANLTEFFSVHPYFYLLILIMFCFSFNFCTVFPIIIFIFSFIGFFFELNITKCFYQFLSLIFFVVRIAHIRCLKTF